MVLEVVGEYTLPIHNQYTLAEIPLIEHEKHVNTHHNNGKPAEQIGRQIAQFSLPHLLAISQHKSNLDKVVKYHHHHNEVPDVQQNP